MLSEQHNLSSIARTRITDALQVGTKIRSCFFMENRLLLVCAFIDEYSDSSIS